jgi:hypothetical protein
LADDSAGAAGVPDLGEIDGVPDFGEIDGVPDFGETEGMRRDSLAGCLGIRDVLTFGAGGWAGRERLDRVGRQFPQKFRLSAVEAFPTRKSSSRRS